MTTENSRGSNRAEGAIESGSLNMDMQYALRPVHNGFTIAKIWRKQYYSKYQSIRYGQMNLKMEVIA